MQWNRDAYLELMTFGKIERPMLVELFGPLIGLEKEWQTQGASPEEVDLTGFDFDFVEHVDCGGITGLLGGVSPHVEEETESYIIQVDGYGRRTKLFKDKATIALPLDYPVADMDSWLKIKPWFTFREDRINWDTMEAAREKQKSGALVKAKIPGGFDLPRQLMGEENVCLCYFDQPELMRDILDTVADTCVKVLDRVSDKLAIDNLCVHEDMAGKSGSLVGPDQINEFIKPYYRKSWDLLRSKCTRLFSQDSDGDMTSVAGAFMDAGINVMFPAEPAAGMDMVKLRQKFGKALAFKGGIDKHVLRRDKPAIRRELEYKMQPLMQAGGVVFGLDHRIPNGTPLDNYRYYVRTAKEILGIPERKGGKGWARMAF